MTDARTHPAPRARSVLWALGHTALAAGIAGSAFLVQREVLGFSPRMAVPITLITFGLLLLAAIHDPGESDGDDDDGEDLAVGPDEIEEKYNE